MKMRILIGVCLLAAVVSGALWEVSSSTAQVAATTPAAAAPADERPVGNVQPAADSVFQPLPGQLQQPGATAAPVPRSNYFYYSDATNSPYRRAGGRALATSIPGQPQTVASLQQAAHALRDAKDDAARADAQAKLTAMLQNFFEEDMRRREQELAKVEERTRQLRELLEKRRAKRQEIVELQMKVLLNEANGLGFFNGASSFETVLPGGEPPRPGYWKTDTRVLVPAEAQNKLPDFGAQDVPSDPLDAAPDVPSATEPAAETDDIFGEAAVGPSVAEPAGSSADPFAGPAISN